MFHEVQKMASSPFEKSWYWSKQFDVVKWWAKKSSIVSVRAKRRRCPMFLCVSTYIGLKKKTIFKKYIFKERNVLTCGADTGELRDSLVACLRNQNVGTWAHQF